MYGRPLTVVVVNKSIALALDLNGVLPCIESVGRTCSGRRSGMCGRPLTVLVNKSIAPCFGFGCELPCIESVGRKPAIGLTGLIVTKPGVPGRIHDPQSHRIWV